MNLLSALAKVGGLTLVSRILGFVRDTVIARAFGAGAATDAFFVAFKIPNLLRRIFAEGAFSQAFVPILAEYKTKRGMEETRTLIDHVSTMLAFALAITTVIGIVGAPVVVWVTSPGFDTDPAKFALTVKLLRLMFPYILLISLASMAGAILNTFNRFAVQAFTPTLLNISFIFFTLLPLKWFGVPVKALAWAVIVGGVAQLLFQVPYLIKMGLMPRLRFSFTDPGMRRMLKLMGPAIMGVSVSQISLLLNTIYASFLPTGSISYLYFADRMMEFPSGVLGAALGTILLPSLSKSMADAAGQEYSRLMDWGLRLSLMLVLPASLGLGVLAVPLVATLFQHGHFTAHDTIETHWALVAYSIGLTGLILVKVLAPGFYARQDIKTPVRIGIISIVSTQLMNLLFVWNLKQAGLALAIGLGACVNAGMLYYHMRKKDFFQPEPGWVPFISRVAAALAVMTVVMLILMGSNHWWLVATTMQRLIRLAIVVSVAALCYFLTLFMVGIKPQHFMKQVTA